MASIDIDPAMLGEATVLLGATSSTETMERALRYTVSEERQILAFERISQREFSDEQTNAPKIDD